MFVLGRALEMSGLVDGLTARAVSARVNPDLLVAGTLAGSGVASAFLMNDTVAVVGTPVAIGIARARGLAPRVFLLALAFGVTLGSVPSPIGNPQNLLIALHSHAAGGAALARPFPTFFAWLIVPTLASLLLAYAVLRVTFPGDFRPGLPQRAEAGRRDPALARLAWAALGVLVLLIAARVVSSIGGNEGMRLTVIALVPAAILLLLSPRRFALASGADGRTLLFFAALFVVVAAVGASGVVADFAARLGPGVSEPGLVLVASGGLSQVVSNVPLVALYLRVLDGTGASEAALMALAAGSTLAGNLTILGAASNVIIVEHAERRFSVRIGFFEFLRAGAPVTLGSLAICWVVLR